MQYFETDGMRLPRICLGCWNISGDATWGPQDENESLATFRVALDHGVNFFDTAPMYGQGYSEELLGRFLRPLRSEVFIATKSTQMRPADLIRSCEDSLRRLRTDYIDVFYLHWPDWQVPAVDTAGALLQLRRQGKIRAAAVSNFGVRDLTDMLAHLRPAVNQLAYSLLFRAIEDEVLPLCLRENVGVAPYSPLAEGLLAGRFRSADEVPEGRARTRLFAGTRPQSRHGEAGAESETFAAIEALREKAGRLGCRLPQLALAWLLAQPGVPFVVAGARRPDQLRQNVEALAVELNDADCRELAALTDALKARLGGNPDMWQAASRIR